MASSTVYNTFKTFLQSKFPGVYPIVDFDTIDEQMEQNKAPFLVLEDMPGEERVFAFGDPTNLCMRASGSVVVYVFNPAPESNDAVRRIGDSIVSAIRLATLPNQIRILSVDPPDIQTSNNGLWTIAVVATNIEHDFFVPMPP